MDQSMEDELANRFDKVMNFFTPTKMIRDQKNLDKIRYINNHQASMTLL